MLVYSWNKERRVTEVALAYPEAVMNALYRDIGKDKLLLAKERLKQS